ncbi:hypothetical protein LCGC14_1615730 [marine sediment metagenome]|uniref:Uncharacterized protein n=1 Tax=marine sediment metagenome TaxID=412755 RepID=A0A0F9L6Y4_9ZZZZ
MYCAVCMKTIFYPLAKLLTGTNMCLKCHIHIKKRAGRWGLRYLFRLLRSKYHCFRLLHKWYVTGGFVDDLNKPVTQLRCHYCFGSKLKGGM